jgi:hypothetical protein
MSIEQCVCGGYPPGASNPDCERCQLIDKIATVTAELAETKERLAAAEDDVNTVLRAAWNSMPRWDSYVHENTHPDCLPEMRFRATMPQGEPRWFATRELAIRAIVEATGKEPTK